MAIAYEYELTGLMPLLMHPNNLDAQAEVKDFIANEGSSLSVAGDDRSPVWTWAASLYVNPETGYLSIPAHCLMAALRIGGGKVKAPQSLGSNWSKASQFGILLQQDWLDVYDANGEPIPVGPLIELKNRDRMLHPSEFPRHQADVEKCGIKLQVIPVVNPQTKRRNIRVRPLIEKGWTIRGIASVSFPAMTQEHIEKIFTASGQFGGLLDWAPHSRKPGPYGTYEASVRASDAGAKSAKPTASSRSRKSA